jgi:hypothetical protein
LRLAERLRSWSSAAPATSREINDLYAQLFTIGRVQISLAGHF